MAKSKRQRRIAERDRKASKKILTVVVIAVVALMALLFLLFQQS